MLAKLKPAIAKVAQTHEEEAERISRFVEASAHEVARKRNDRKVLREFCAN